MTKKTYVDLSNARYDDQKKIMEEIVQVGHCPFCPENFTLYNEEPPLKDGTHWYLVRNKWPYINTKQHFLFITKAHIEHFSELNAEASAELIEMSAWAIENYQIPGGALTMRFGDTSFSAGSVVHLHAQLIHPDIDSPTFAEQPVRLKIGKARKK